LRREVLRRLRGQRDIRGDGDDQGNGDPSQHGELLRRKVTRDPSGLCADSSWFDASRKSRSWTGIPARKSRVTLPAADASAPRTS
jgi:hypothetical protein